MRNKETEVKFRVTDLRNTRRRLRELGFRQSHARSLEDNTLFDTPDRALRKVRSVLRLRSYGSQWILTFKGTPASHPLYKSRLEAESEVRNPEAIRILLQSLGFVPAFRYQKYRTHFAAPEDSRAQACDVALDETPIGNFLELEGSRRAIDRVARQLGYSRADYMTASYGALYLEECARKNVVPGDMLFPAPPTRSRRARPK